MSKYDYKKHKKIRRSVYERYPRPGVFHAEVRRPAPISDIDPDWNFNVTGMHDRVVDRALQVDRMAALGVRSYMEDMLHRRLWNVDSQRLDNRTFSRLVDAHVQHVVQDLTTQGVTIVADTRVEENTIYITANMQSGIHFIPINFTINPNGDL